MTVYFEVNGGGADSVMHAAVMDVEPGDCFGAGRGNSASHEHFLVTLRWSME